jgi:D-alanine transaminase
MSRIAYVNGQYVSHRMAGVHIEDRGYQFADGVYEVIAVRGGQLVDLDPHFDRLDRSLDALKIAQPMSRGALAVVVGQTVRRNLVRDGIVYMQITRGVAPRFHPFPLGADPAVVVTARTMAPPSAEIIENGARVVTMADIRWGRCDIKSIALLPNILAKQHAVESGAYEAWLVDEDGYVTDGSASNAWIVNSDGVLVTRDLSTAILGGITRSTVLDACSADGIAVLQGGFTPEQAKNGREAMITSTTSFVAPVVNIDGSKVGDGRPGPVFQRLRALYMAHLNPL